MTTHAGGWGRKLIFALLLIAGMMGLPGARAQQAPALTLEEALDLAARRNLDLAAARRERAVAQAGIRVASRRPNPVFNFTALRDAPHEGFFIDQPIETAGKRGRRIQVAQQEKGLTEIDIGALERQIREQARGAYYGLAYARAETARLGEIVHLAERLQQIAEDRFQAGAVPELEVIQAGLQLAQAQTDFEVARETEKVSLSQLNALLDEPASHSWQLTGTLYAPIPDLALPQLLQTAYHSNARLQSLAQQAQVEQSRLSLAKAERVPDLDLEFGVDFNAPGDFRAGPRSQISLRVPLFYRNQGEIAQALANRDVLEGQIAATRRSVAGKVETAYFDLEAQKKKVEIYHSTLVPAAQKLEQMAEESYHAGKTNILAVLDAQRNVQDVLKTYQQGLLDLQTAFAVLEQTVGAPLE